MIQTGSEIAAQAHKQGRRIPAYKFLGFTCYWGQSRNGWWRLKYKTRSDRFTTKLNGLRKYLRENRNTQTHKILARVKKVAIGWVSYHAISDNQKRVSSFILECKRALFRWINRKGGNRYVSWGRFGNILKQIRFPQNFKTKSMFSAC
jgi:RNA-directed DNA polymerase